MATGPEHYKLAEVAQQAAAATQGEKLNYTVTEALLDALVHATLALAAATALSGGPMAHADDVAWTAAAGATLDISGQQT